MNSINENTKILHILDQNDLAIDAIAKVNSNFTKLRNPILRKLLAKRVNVKQAASIGGVHPNVLLSELSKIGFIVEYTCEETEKINKSKFNHMHNLETVSLDVRPILAGGVDPFKQIMAKLEELTDNQELLIINTFEPIPLLNILKDKGYNYETIRPSEGEVHTRLYKVENFVSTPKLKTVDKKDWSFADAEVHFKGHMNEVDVRDLEMPLPMVTILEEVEKVNDGEALYVHHKKLPQYLIPELENRGFAFVSNEIDEQNIKLIIYKS